MSSTPFGLLETVRRRAPTVDEAHDKLREATLVLLTLLTTLSLLVFWSELAAQQGLAQADILPIVLAFDALTILLLLWLGAKVVRIITGLMP